MHELGRSFFEAWRRGGAWDEARPDGEVLRASAEARDASATGVLREMVLEALSELADGNWVPWSAVLQYLRADSRTPGLERLLERWASRTQIEGLAAERIAERIALESLHVLGAVDIGEPDELPNLSGPILRITPRGRAYLRRQQANAQPEASRFIDGQTLRIGPEARVGHVVGLAPFVELGAVAGCFDVLVTPQAIAHALSAGIESDILRSRLEAIAPLPDPIARVLQQASAVIGRAEFVETQGFLWVEDPEIRELLRTRRQTVDLFIDPSPPAGLLVAAGIDLDRLARRCRSLGVELIYAGQPYRTRSTLPPNKGSGQHRLDSSSSLQAVRSPDSRPPVVPRRRPSSTSMNAAKRPTR